MELQVNWTKGIVTDTSVNNFSDFSAIRFRDVPTFGRDSIRRFTNNVSELKKLGARDYENLLQVSIF